MAGTKIRHRSGVADGATAIGHELDTKESLVTAGSKILSVKNAGVEKFAISKDGEILSSGAGGTWVVRPAEGGAGIQAAITAAATAGGGTVQLLSGTYVISSTITVPGANRLTIQGMGADTILDNQQSAGAAVLSWADQRGGNTGSHGLDPTTRGATSVTFSIITNAANYAAGIILVITGNDADGLPRAELAEALAVGDGGTGILTLTRPLQYSLTSVNVTGYLNGKDFVVKNFRIIHTAGAGSGIGFFGIRGHLENLVLDGANFSATSVGFSVNGYGTTVRNCHVLNYNFASAGDTMRGAIFNGIELSVEDCKFINSGSNTFANNCGVEFRSAYKCTFINNVIRNCKANGIRLWNAGPASDITIANNIIVNNDGVGLYVISATQDPDVIITGNEISYNTSNGIDCSGIRAIISGNRVSYNGVNGIRQFGNDGVISGNECRGNTTGDGIASTGARCVITANRCASNATSGINVTTGGDNTVVSGNATNSNTTRGIILGGTASGCSVTGNTSVSNTGAELEVANTANDNLISSNNCIGGTIVEGTGTNLFTGNLV